MVRTKNTNIWDKYTMFIDKSGKECYKCKACGNDWAKNTTRLQEYLDTCTLCKTNKSSNINKKQKLLKLDNFTKQDQIELETLLAHIFYTSGASFSIVKNVDFQAFLKKASVIYAIVANNSAEINKNIKAIIIDYTFWTDLKNLCNFLKPFIVFIKQLEGDELYLSSVYKTLQELKNKFMTNLQVSTKLHKNTLQAAKNC
ncbi:13722_t:CDS:2 [Dentiscutata erythropus]|uniref:13722_t:CDS:1 n=1 Tax=Dentiscutata erythropus TaxID=1348616 RepID=A0A9N9HXJ6_9GLOM|nr:13722_t:CDS:2 [Dentiscutata erythropus]